MRQQPTDRSLIFVRSIISEGQREKRRASHFQVQSPLRIQASCLSSFFFPNSLLPPLCMQRTRLVIFEREEDEANFQKKGQGNDVV